MEGNAALTTRGFDHAELVKDLRKQVTSLEDDLRVRSEEAEFAPALEAEYADARKAERTAATYGAWRDERVTQVAVAWVLGTVFVRFCEDNGLIEWPFIAGPGERLADAVERHDAFFTANPQLNDRDWIVAAFDYLTASHPTVAGLFDKRYNPLWEITPSFEQATALLKFWRGRGDGVEIRYDFTDDEWDTRFLGDLYQDLSEHARKTYALLQTPEFVEEFILDLTLEPAIEKFGLKGLRTIDPACGSGHFVLGIFHRLLEKWRAAEPGTDHWELIRRSTESVHGCDKNPFAVSIARFRLLVAALRVAGSPALSAASIFPINIAVGDSLLHGRGAPAVQAKIEIHEGKLTPSLAHTYRTEDVRRYDFCDLLGASSYHVVVGNPPYITVKDKQENINYRSGYSACTGKYALSVPFAQRLFHLAVRKDGSERDAGYVGQITANSFMKREFGKKLIEGFFQKKVHLTHIIDTSGAYIPGHGTPTVILVGRNHPNRINDPIRTVLGVQGEPTQPTDPSNGLVWTAIINQAGNPGAESKWVSVTDTNRIRFCEHPWSLSGGGAGDIRDTIEEGTSRLGDASNPVGFMVITGFDEAYCANSSLPPSWSNNGLPAIPFYVGDMIRDWGFTSSKWAAWPYQNNKGYSNSTKYSPFWERRTILREGLTFGKTREERGLMWHEYTMMSWHRHKAELSIVYAFLGTGMQFSLRRNDALFNHSAPVITLPTGATEDDYLGLLGALNSSTSCFWLKQVCHNKGGPGGGSSKGEKWRDFYEITGTKLHDFPVPSRLQVDLSRSMDTLAQKFATLHPSWICRNSTPTRDELQKAQTTQESTRNQMIALQEELDWRTYGDYGLLNEGEVANLAKLNQESIPEIEPGQRAFEILLARQIQNGNIETRWFEDFKATITTTLPDSWPEPYKSIVTQRILCIENRSEIALIEQQNCKRTWAQDSWEKREAEALRNWLLDRCEKPELWFALRDGMNHPRALTVSQLADQFRDDADMNSVAQLYATDHLGKRDLTLAQILEQVVADQHVPFLAALRYKDTGLRKRAQWEEVWDLQRKEDATGERLDIAVPPKYGSGDFRKTSYWSQRGKLDVPKERFISYPDASPDADPTLLLGWAGWDHKDQAQALVNIVNDRTEQFGWDTARITPLLAGLLEVMPWVKQWHGEYDAEWDGNPHEEYSTYLNDQRTKNQLTEDDLRAWRPVPMTRGRRAAKKD